MRNVGNIVFVLPIPCSKFFIMKYFTYLLISVLTACSTVSNQHTIDNQPVKSTPKLEMLDATVFGEPLDLISVDQIFELDEDQKNKFLSYFNAPENRRTPANKRIYNYLEDRLEHFNYRADTFIATESLSKNQGNCLSLAILTTALAKIVGVEYKFQLVETEPVYQREGNIILTSQHIRTVLYNPLYGDDAPIGLFRGNITIDYFPVGHSRTLRSVEEGEFYAMYFDNKAAEYFIVNDINAAFWYTKKSLEINPDGALAINMAAMVHQHEGYLNYADSLYLYGLEMSSDKLTLLSNYRSLLLLQGRLEESEKITLQLKKIDESNPFKWISVGNAAYNKADYSMAIFYYRKANKLAPYLHETFAGISRAEYLLGNLDSSKKSIAKAIDQSYKKSTRDIYQAKYDMLTQLLRNPDSEL
jgi:tetratricopeptide (TPR) repeat protein